jgi:hypothetical protein
VTTKINTPQSETLHRDTQNGVSFFISIFVQINSVNMLSTSDVYQLLLDELRTDARGLSCELSEYNRLIRLVNQELYEDYVKAFEDGQESSDSLGFLKMHNYPIALVAGVGTLPASYERLIGKPRILVGTTTVNVDPVSTFELASRADDYLTQPTTTYPTCTIGGVDGLGSLQIRVSPTTVTNVWIDYLRTLTVPFLDYRIDNLTYVPTFFAETTTLQSLPLGSTYRTGTVGGAGVTVASVSKDFRWSDSDLPLLLTKLVNRLAKQLPDELLLQTSSAEQAKFDKE